MSEHNMQELLNRIIDAGHYQKEYTQTASEYMCNAALLASDAGVITVQEALYVERECLAYIQELLPGTSAPLNNALFHAGLPSGFNERLAIYRDWANRPMPV